jgi:hypothetical protein
MSIISSPASFYNQEAFDFMPNITQVEVEPLRFTWKGVKGCSFDPTSRTVTAPLSAADPELGTRINPPL